MQVTKLIGALCAFVLLAGCDQIVPPPTIDASTTESLQQSSQKLRESLPESKRADFDSAMQVLAFSQVDFQDVLTGAAGSAANLQEKMKQSLHGKTAEEVLAEAERIQLERKAREKEQALNEIKELERERQVAAVAKEKIKAFEVLRSRFYMREERFSGKQPIIELTVRNGTDEAVSRAYFEGTIASPDRSVPWHKDSFNYSISGGLEPGEEATWSLAPNMFSDWGKVDAPADAVFTVTVKRLDGAEGQPLYSPESFSARDEQRLTELKEKYGIQ